MTPPTFLLLIACLKRMSAARRIPRLRFILPNKARLDFHYFPDEPKSQTHLNYREPKRANHHLGVITDKGHFIYVTDQYNLFGQHVGGLLHNLQTDFPRAVTSYGHRLGLCALCGKPLTDPTALARGTTPNCHDFLTTTPATAEDI